MVEIVNISEASKILRVDRRTFKARFINTGLIPILQFSHKKRPLMLKDDLIKFIYSQRGFNNEHPRRTRLNRHARRRNPTIYSTTKKEAQQ